MTRGLRGALALAGIGALTGCRERVPVPDGVPAALRVTARSGALNAPDSLPAGWTRLHVEEAEGRHIVVAFRLPAAATKAEVQSFVAALDTAPATPLPGVAIGGPENGAMGDAIVQLTPGVYVLACVRRGEDGHRHAVNGEAATVHVHAAVAGAETATGAGMATPASSATVGLADFAYTGPSQWAPGAQLLRLENTGRQDHQLRLARLRDGVSLAAWMDAEEPDSVATTLAGMARLGPGQVAYLPVELTRGTYVVYCLVPDAQSKRPHVELGMLREIRVP